MQIGTPQIDIKQTRADILREWFALAPDQRATEIQAASFADRALQSHGLDANRESSALIKSWLVRYTGLRPFE